MKPEVRYHRFVRCSDENPRYLGQVVVIQQGREALGIFRPAVDRPEFHKDQNLTEAFFQSRVDDARWWWQRHREEYVTGAAAGDRTANHIRPRKPRQAEDPGLAGKKGLHFTLEKNGKGIWMLALVIGTAIILRRVLRKPRMAS